MSALEFVSTFFSPTYLFLVLNLIIGTIFLTSRLGSHHPAKAQPAPLARTPSSLIDRVRSINLSLYKFESHPEGDPVQHYYPGPDGEMADGPRFPIARRPSLLDRLRSVNFYRQMFEPVNPEPEPEPLHRVDHLSRAPSSLLDRLKSINFHYQKVDHSTSSPQEIDRSMDVPDAAPLARAPSFPFLEHVGAMKFPSSYYHHQDAEPVHDDANHLANDHEHGPVRRIRSESDRVGEQGPKPRMGKTASEKSAVDEAGEDNVEVEEINVKAADFIHRFRQQLRLQRLDSLMRNEDMLTGGCLAGG